MKSGNQGIGRVAGLARQPAAEIVGPVQPAEQQRLGRARPAHRVRQRLHAGRLPTAGGRATVPPAVPADPVRRTVQVKDHRRVGLEGGRHRLPEVRSVIRIGHHRLVARQALPRRTPGQREDDVQAGLVQQVDVADNRPLVVAAGIGSIDAVDPQPAVFVQLQAHGIRMPAGDGRRRGAVAGSVEDSPALNARIEGSDSIDAMQLHHRSAAVDQVIPLHRERRYGRRRRRDRGRGADAGSQRAEHQRPAGHRRDERATDRGEAVTAHPASDARDLGSRAEIGNWTGEP